MSETLVITVTQEQGSYIATCRRLNLVSQGETQGKALIVLGKTMIAEDDYKARGIADAEESDSRICFGCGCRIPDIQATTAIRGKNERWRFYHDKCLKKLEKL